jgi:hypothetical protein
VLLEGLCDEVIGLEMDDHNYRVLQENLGRLPGVRLIQGSLLGVAWRHHGRLPILSMKHFCGFWGAYFFRGRARVAPPLMPPSTSKV